MALLTKLEIAQAVEIGQLYGLQVTSVEALAAGSVNSNFRLQTRGGDPYFARIYEEQRAAGAEGELRLLRELAALGVPTTVPPLRTDGGLLSSHGGKPVALYPWVDGELLCTQQAVPERCERLGSALARVHLATAQLSDVPVGRFEVSQLRERLDQVRANGRSSLQAPAERIEALLAEWWPRRDPDLPRGLIHGDLFRDNVIWQGPSIAALIDFESACEGVFVYDLMVCVLAWCFTDHFEPSRVRALIQGYSRERALSAAERAALVGEGVAACLRFASTRLTDFSLRVPEGKAPLRDYSRFLQRLEELTSGQLDSALGLSA